MSQLFQRISFGIRRGIGQSKSMNKSKKYKGRGKKVSDTEIFGIPAVVYRIEYDEPVMVNSGEVVKETQQYHADGSVTVEGEVVKGD